MARASACTWAALKHCTQGRGGATAQQGRVMGLRRRACRLRGSGPRRGITQAGGCPWAAPYPWARSACKPGGARSRWRRRDGAGAHRRLLGGHIDVNGGPGDQDPGAAALAGAVCTPGRTVHEASALRHRGRPSREAHGAANTGKRCRSLCQQSMGRSQLRARGATAGGHSGICGAVPRRSPGLHSTHFAFFDVRRQFAGVLPLVGMHCRERAM